MKKMNSKGKYEIFCHKCGKKMQMTNGIVTEGIIRLQGKWGYFSNKDLQMHTMDLCEECYDSIATLFKYPVDFTEYISVEDDYYMFEKV